MIKAGRSSIIHETLEKSFLDGPRFKFSFWDRSERFYGIPFFFFFNNSIDRVLPGWIYLVVASFPMIFIGIKFLFYGMKYRRIFIQF